MDDRIVSEEHPTIECNERFLEFIKLLGRIENDRKLFPKECRTCGEIFVSLSDYLCATTPKGHSLQDGQEVMGKPFTMIYRHCTCGNTLVLTLTEDIFPALDALWSMLKQEALRLQKPLKIVVAEFAGQWEHYLTTQVQPCRRRFRG